MRIRYFFRMGQDNQPLTLFRLLNDDGVRTLVEHQWLGDWLETNRLSEALVTGDVNFDEVSEQVAAEFFPQAFRGPAEDGLADA